MEFWDKNKGCRVESKQVENFLKDIDIVSEHHNLSISHEDKGGSFIITERDKGLIEWLNGACVKDLPDTELTIEDLTEQLVHAEGRVMTMDDFMYCLAKSEGHAIPPKEWYDILKGEV